MDSDLKGGRNLHPLTGRAQGSSLFLTLAAPAREKLATATHYPWEGFVVVLEEYGKYLCETGFCAATIRGYLSDIRSFARWFSVTLGEKRILERAAVHI